MNDLEGFLFFQILKNTFIWQVAKRMSGGGGNVEKRRGSRQILKKNKRTCLNIGGYILRQGRKTHLRLQKEYPRREKKLNWRPNLEKKSPKEDVPLALKSAKKERKKKKSTIRTVGRPAKNRIEVKNSQASDGLEKKRGERAYSKCR